MTENNKHVEKEKKRLMRVMKRNPHAPRTEWAIRLDWLNAKDLPDQPKITKRLKQLEDDGLVIKIGHKYIEKL